jgi:hypothetical protein
MNPAFQPSKKFSNNPLSSMNNKNRIQLKVLAQLEPWFDFIFQLLPGAILPAVTLGLSDKRCNSAPATLLRPTLPA